MKKNKLRDLFINLPVAWKFFLEITVTTVVLFASNLFIYGQINKMVGQMDKVYLSNVNVTELSDGLERVQNYMYNYLQVRDSASLTDYYRAEQNYNKLLRGLNTTISDNPTQLLEKNIYNMSENYLILTGQAVQAKRGQNVERYKSLYESALKLYKYINNDISVLNAEHFKNNSASYRTLQAALRYLEIASSAILLIVMVVGITIMTVMTKHIVAPLTDLALAAKLVGQGNFRVKVPHIHSGDEIGIVTVTFNKMVDGLLVYVNKIREGARKEQEMKKRELLMETHLKEAQLKYLQSQINPHFLFNCLNAGVQLAVMEDAEKTSVFMEKMADFFRYNVKKGIKEATIKDEVAAVENYVYILNVRFAGDILFWANVQREANDFPIPSMILQPLIENAVTHGISNIERRGEIFLTVTVLEDIIEIRIEDNGRGIDPDSLEKIRRGEFIARKTESTGIGLLNVIKRLSLFYNDDGIFNIYSGGAGLGTAVVLKLPRNFESAELRAEMGGQNVSDTLS